MTFVEHIYIYIFFSFGYIPLSGIAGSWDLYMFILGDTGSSYFRSLEGTVDLVEGPCVYISFIT